MPVDDVGGNRPLQLPRMLSDGFAQRGGAILAPGFLGRMLTTLMVSFDTICVAYAGCFSGERFPAWSAVAAFVLVQLFGLNH